MSDEIKYYLFYYVNNSENSLYAYTSLKEEANAFRKFRNDSVIMKKKKLDILERRYLCSNHSDCRMQEYEFTFEDSRFKLFLTYKEILYLEAILTKIDILLPGCATINPMIFNDKINKALECIRYNEFFLKYYMGIDTMLDQDKFSLFVNTYGEMLNMKAIRNEVII